eukprot:323272-Hanusia_phi.AAC.3
MKYLAIALLELGQHFKQVHCTLLPLPSPSSSYSTAAVTALPPSLPLRCGRSTVWRIRTRRDLLSSWSEIVEQKVYPKTY